MVRMVSVRPSRDGFPRLTVAGVYQESRGEPIDPAGGPQAAAGCAGAALAVLRQAGRPLTARQVHRRLVEAGRHWPRSSVRVRLYFLVRRGLAEAAPGPRPRRFVAAT